VNIFDKRWILTCFGTAVGAGILFLPIQTGSGDIWSILFLTFIIFPVTYISHRGITRITSSCPNKIGDIIEVIKYDLGFTAGFIVSILYFLSIVTLCVGYATGLTNIVNSFLINQMHIFKISRPIITFIVLAVLTLVLIGNEKIMTYVTSIMAFPLIILLVMISVYMIPHWNVIPMFTTFSIKRFLKSAFLLLPILIFAMNFSPICSLLGMSCRKQYNNIVESVKHSDLIVKWNSIFLLIFIMFFVFSLFFSTTPEILTYAKQNNIDALTAIALTYNDSILLYVLPVISLLAIISSYFGHFIGTREGLNGILMQIIIKNFNVKNDINTKRKLKIINTIILFTILWILAIFNPPILSVIGILSAPIIAIYAYLMPVILMNKIQRLNIYRSKLAILVFIVGIFVIFGYFIGQII
jgi:serine transporter